MMVCVLCTRDGVYYHARINKEDFGRVFIRRTNNSQGDDPLSLSGR